MKNVLCALAILFATCTPTFAQTGVTGTWQAPGVGPGGTLEVVLRVDGSRLTGLVNQCAPRLAEISDGRIDGNAITFTCKRIDNVGTVAFTGTMNGDEIAFTWELRLGNGAAPPPLTTQMFGPSTPLRFVAKRVPDGNLAKLADQPGGVELSATLNLLQKNMRVIGTLFLPHKVTRVRAVIVVFRWGNGSLFYPDPEARRLAETTGSGLLLTDFATITTPIDNVPRFVGPDGTDGLLMLLRRLAEESGHRELADVPLLFWGHSAAGNFGPVFATMHPQRTIAFVLYQSAAIESVRAEADIRALSQIPVLIVKDGTDGTAFSGTVSDPSETLWRRGRSAGAAWTFAAQPDAPHGAAEYLKKANDVLIPWITAVLRQRLSPDGKTLRVVTDGSGWLGSIQTGEVAPAGTFVGSKPEANWLPDEATARGWRVVVGAAK